MKYEEIFGNIIRYGGGNMYNSITKRTIDLERAVILAKAYKNTADA